MITCRATHEHPKICPWQLLDSNPVAITGIFLALVEALRVVAESKIRGVVLTGPM